MEICKKRGGNFVGLYEMADWVYEMKRVCPTEPTDGFIKGSLQIVYVVIIVVYIVEYTLNKSKGSGKSNIFRIFAVKFGTS